MTIILLPRELLNDNGNKKLITIKELGSIYNFMVHIMIFFSNIDKDTSEINVSTATLKY